MEVKLFFDDGDGGVRVESHKMPEWVGRTVTRSRGSDGRVDVTTSEADLVGDVVETLRVGDGGITLTRRVMVSERSRIVYGAEAPEGSSCTLRLLAAERMRDLTRVTADGETVWPAEESEAVEDPAVAALGKVSSQIDQLVRETA